MKRDDLEIKQKILLSVVLAVILCFCNFLQAADSHFTPLPGDPLRKQVLDALRKEVNRVHGLDVIFVVRYLKVKDGWAWVHTQPQSQDGSDRYEDISALLQFQNGKWTVVEIPCGEEENPDCLNGPEYFVELQTRFPTVPIEIFPNVATKRFP